MPPGAGQPGAGGQHRGCLDQRGEGFYLAIVVQCFVLLYLYCISNSFWNVEILTWLFAIHLATCQLPWAVHGAMVDRCALAPAEASTRKMNEFPFFFSWSASLLSFLLLLFTILPLLLLFLLLLHHAEGRGDPPCCGAPLWLHQQAQEEEMLHPARWGPRGSPGSFCMLAHPCTHSDTHTHKMPSPFSTF